MTEHIADLVRAIPDYPAPGVIFRDITPVLADGPALSAVVEALSAGCDDVDVVVGVEARGFILAAPIAVHLGVGFVPARKAGKLPAATHAQGYELEYAQAVLEIHRDAILPGQRVLIVDDVLATGGTALAAAALVSASGGTVVALRFLLDIAALGGRDRLSDYPVTSLLTY